MDEISLAAGASLPEGNQQETVAELLADAVESHGGDAVQSHGGESVVPIVCNTDIAALVMGGILCAMVLWATRATRTRKISTPAKVEEIEKLVAFKKRYLAAYLLAFFADWSMGAYIYTLYSSYYHYSMGAIAHLFIIGFGSALVVGTYLGTLADRLGRKRICQVYCILYTIACILKNWDNYTLLMVGRLFGGVATSLLYSGFESWGVSEFQGLGLNAALLADVFAQATFFNAFGAILAGLFSNAVANKHGAVGPFNAAIVPLMACLAVVTLSWKENYGCRESSVGDSMTAAIAAMARDRKMLVTGIVSGLFEAVMYIFVFMWTPELERLNPALSHGFVFAVFMIWKMAGSYIFLLVHGRFGLENSAVLLFFMGSMCLLVPIASDEYTHILAAFCLFEMVIGVYWPTIGTLRSKYIENKVRATTMNLFRVPLNVFVVLTLFKVGDMEQSTVFISSAAALITAAGLSHWALHDKVFHVFQV